MATKGLRQNNYNSVLAIDIGIYTRSEMLAKRYQFVRHCAYLSIVFLGKLDT